MKLVISEAVAMRQHMKALGAAANTGASPICAEDVKLTVQGHSNPYASSFCCKLQHGRELFQE